MLLAGTEFELLDQSGNHVATATTDESGVATFSGLAPGSYTVVEATPPQGFKLSENPFQSVTVTAGIIGSDPSPVQSPFGRLFYI